MEEIINKYEVLRNRNIKINFSNSKFIIYI